jgi:tetratricopeptide (TPR) repeat protein
MWGRLFGLLAGLALCGEALILWRPEVIGGAPSPDLGPFTSYRLIIAALAAAAGGIVVVAALLREPTMRVLRPAPAGADWTPVEPAAAKPDFAILPAEPIAAQAASPHEAQEAHEPLDPFPGETVPQAIAAAPEAVAEPAPEPAPAPPSAPAAPAAVASGERGTFLAAIDAGDQLRAANRLDDAMELYDGALALARRAHGAAPSDATARRDMAHALTSVADLHDRDGRLEPALALHEESLGLRRSLAVEAPEDLAAQRGLSLGLERLADAREARGHRSRARDLLRERLPIAERLAGMAPSDAGLAQDLTSTRERLKELDEALAP